MVKVVRKLITFNFIKRNGTDNKFLRGYFLQFLESPSVAGQFFSRFFDKI